MTETDDPAVSAGQPDAVLAGAVDLAREAAVETGGEAVGGHLGVIAEDGLLVTHTFESKLPGYVGWYWAVSLVRAPDVDEATVADVVLLPGAQALLAPAWVPWSERLRPGDLGPGDLLPPDPADPRLVPAYLDNGDKQEQEVAFELGLGRERVMSREGRLDTAERWHDGDYGPDTPMARHAPARCGTCGFLLPLAGSLQAGFGVCGNEISSADGHAVSVEYGCGAHSQTRLRIAPLSERQGDVYEDGEDIAIVRVAEIAQLPGENSEGAALTAVLDHEDEPEQAEDAAVETGPEPEAVAVVVEPAPEAGEDDGQGEPDGGTD